MVVGPFVSSLALFTGSFKVYLAVAAILMVSGSTYWLLLNSIHLVRYFSGKGFPGTLKPIMIRGVNMEIVLIFLALFGATVCVVSGSFFMASGYENLNILAFSLLGCSVWMLAGLLPWSIQINQSE